MEDTSLDEFFGSDDEREDAEETDSDTAQTEQSGSEGEQVTVDETESDKKAGGVTENVQEPTTAEDESEQKADKESTSTTNSTPAVSTSRWAGTDDSCAQCGSGGVRLWSEDGEFVCQACKEW